MPLRRPAPSMNSEIHGLVRSRVRARVGARARIRGRIRDRPKVMISAQVLLQRAARPAQW